MILEDAIKLAVRILENGTEYIFVRTIIDKLFKETKDYTIENIALRLSVVDSFYSTNMNRRLFGITDLATEIYNIGDEKSIIEEIEKYKKTETSKIDELLNNNYGIRKTGKVVGEARSLISKYLYFVTEHNFPIEDNLVKNNINSVLKYFSEPEFKSDDLLKNLIDFCTKRNIKFVEFDNFMWLFGKVNKGSFSLIFKKDNYLKIINTLQIEGETSTEFDKNFATAIHDVQNVEKIKMLITEELYKFLLLSIDIYNHENN